MLGTIATIWFLAFIVPKIPNIQNFLGNSVSSALAEKLGTKVQIGKVDVRLPWRIIIDDVVIYDQQGKKMLRAGRIAAGIEIIPLLQGKIRITSAQLFATHLALYQKTADSPLNCQFVIDSLKSRDTTSHTPLDLAIASVIIRHSSVKYDRWDVPHTKNRFNIAHLDIEKLSSNFILHALTDDSVNVQIKHLSLREHSGLTVNNITGNIQASKNDALVSGLSCVLPNSSLNIDGHMSPVSKENGNGSIIVNSYITPADFCFLEPKLAAFRKTVLLRARAKGNAKDMRASLNISTDDKKLKLSAAAHGYNIFDNPNGTVSINSAHFSQHLLGCLDDLDITLPQQVRNLGDISLSGKIRIQNKTSFNGNATISMANAGKATVTASYHNKALEAKIQTPGLALNHITGEQKLGRLVCNLEFYAKNIDNIKDNTSARGTISEVSYNNYTYRNISLNTSLRKNIISGTLDINDPNALLHATGCGNIETKQIFFANINLTNFYPQHLFGSSNEANNITKILGETPLTAKLNINPHKVALISDIADIDMNGNINLTTLPYSISNLILSQLASMPWLTKHSATHNNFSINTTIKDVSILRRLLKTDFTTSQDIKLKGFVNDDTHTADLSMDIPEMKIGNKRIIDTRLHLFTPDNTIRADILTSVFVDDSPVNLSLSCIGKNNNLTSVFSWNNQRDDVFRGQLTACTRFYSTFDGKTSISSVIPYSTFQVQDSIWTVQARQIAYSNNKVEIDNFRLGNATQSVYLNGALSQNTQDSLIADLHNINVRYILDLVDFHSVDFDGKASGHFVGRNILSDVKADGYLDVDTFQFEKGNLGKLHIDATYSNATKRINIDAHADDRETDGITLIKGYITPTSPGGLDLNIEAGNSRLEFMQTFCSSFMKNAKLNGSGRLRLYGPFSNINLTGNLVAKGTFLLSTTNCTYTLPNDTIKLIPDDIMFQNIPLLDNYGNKAVLNGGIHHKHLTRLSYDINATTTRFLAYNIPIITGDDTFCGKALINGNIGIHGKGNELMISCEATPLEGSFITYNASASNSISNGEIITWKSASLNDTTYNPQKENIEHKLLNSSLDNGNDRTNIHMNFQIHANTDTHLHLIMDQAAGDYIDLFGNGDLRAEYYNKGAFNLFGNYEVHHGTYKMTLQRIIRRDFSFRKGGTISFGGNPYDALINLHAVYALNSVPLADLNIGANFATNNVPVNCLMNITGTPGMPKVAFGVELPTLSFDAREMVNSVINSEEEMNQQVLYLLAIGRFYAPNNTANIASSTSSSSTTQTQEMSQSTLAIQSFLSGTISQQFNNVMSSVMSNLMKNGNNLSFGANIAPGNEGFNNAEYEGLLSGNFFNNRLIFNGQFGYRDRVATNTSSFIGDFTLQYLLTHNGAISLKVYNQTNDRYFTKSSLNTQGIGLVFQKEWGK